MHPFSAPSIDPSTLLAEFVSGREEAFAQLVDQYGGLVYSSALRRVGDPQLAEEIAQDVFTLLARQAPVLRTHAAPVAWIFKTTKHKASHAMRTERRRNKKHLALAAEASELSEIGDSGAGWSEIKPVLDESLDALSEKDRQIVLLRFFEQLKFKEIAERSGRSEGACKMHLQRAVDRLSAVMAGRGAALPAAALAAGITGVLTQGAPAKVVASLAPKALAAVSVQVTTTSALQGAVSTMSQLKASCLTGIAVLAATAGPAVWQHSKAQQLNLTLSELEAQRESLALKLREEGGDRDRASLGARRGGRPVAARVRSMLAEADRDKAVADLVRDLAAAVAADDLVEIGTALLPISNLTAQEFVALIDEIESIEGQAQMKDAALDLIAPLAPTEDPKIVLDRMVGVGLSSYHFEIPLESWGKTDPDAALEWFEKTTASGELAGKGTWDWESAEADMLGSLLGAIAQTDPGRALELIERESPEVREMAASGIAWSIGESLAAGGSDALLRELIGGSRNAYEIVAIASLGAVPQDDFDAGLEFAQRYLPDPRDQLRAMSEVLDYSELPHAELVKWMQANGPAELRGEMAERWAPATEASTR